MFKFVIDGRLPSLNEVLTAMNTQRGKWNRWNSEKHKYEARVIKAIDAAGKPERMFVKPIRIHFDFYEKDARRDCDNISGAAHKIVMDALQRAEVIRNDSVRYVKGHSDAFYIDPARPRIEITIYTADEETQNAWRESLNSFLRHIEEIEARDTDWE